MKLSRGGLGLFAFICASLQAQWNLTVLAPTGASRSAIAAIGENYQVGHYASSGAAYSAIWYGSSNSVTNIGPLTPYPTATSSNQMVGSLWWTPTSGPSPVMWTGGSTSDLRDLRPSGYDGWAEVLAMNNTQQGGYVSTSATPGIRYAALWSGSPESFINLDPGGAFNTGSRVFAMSSSQQGGIATAGGRWFAALWSGTASSFVSLHSSGGTTVLDSSAVFAMTDTAQGGMINYGISDGYHDQAAIWYGSADSRVDLHPTGATESSVKAMAGRFQAGDVDTQAAVWSGSAESYVNLHPYVSSALGTDFTQSFVTAAYTNSSQLFLAGYAYDPTHDMTAAVMWTMAIPEPSASGMLVGAIALGVIVWAKRQRTRKT